MGSEMCIRDRLRHVGEQVKARRIHVHHLKLALGVSLALIALNHQSLAFLALELAAPNAALTDGLGHPVNQRAFAGSCCPAKDDQ